MWNEEDLPRDENGKFTDGAGNGENNNAGRKTEEKAGNIAGFYQLGQMREQLDVMLRYSGILNTRILTWRHNK